MASEIEFPRPGGGTSTITLPSGPQILAGLWDADAATSVSKGGKAFTVLHDIRREYVAEWHGMTRVGSTPGTMFQRLSEWLSVAYCGALWHLASDSAKKFNSVFAGTESVGATQIETDDDPSSGSAVAVGDYLWVEPLDNPLLAYMMRVSEVGSYYVKNVPGIAFATPAGSTIRHLEYFRDCLLLSTSTPLVQRPAMRGALWDLSVRFRTTR